MGGVGLGEHLGAERVDGCGAAMVDVAGSVHDGTRGVDSHEHRTNQLRALVASALETNEASFAQFCLKVCPISPWKS